MRSSVGATYQLTGRSYGATENINTAETINRSSLTGLFYQLQITDFCDERKAIWKAALHIEFLQARAL
jgi:hypothetical protein